VDRAQIWAKRGRLEDTRAELDRAHKLGSVRAKSVLESLFPVAVVIPAGLGGRVRHKVFGEGTITRLLEGDKLEIAFDSAGSKTLLRKFIE